MKPKFYVYAGYYELYVSAKPMDMPGYFFQSWHRKIERAIEKAESFDDTVHYCENVREYLPQWLKDVLDENNSYFNF